MVLKSVASVAIFFCNTPKIKKSDGSAHRSFNILKLTTTANTAKGLVPNREAPF